MLNERGFPEGLTVEGWLLEHGWGYIGLEHIGLDDDGEVLVNLNAPIFGPDIQSVEGFWPAVRRGAGGLYEIKVPKLPSYLESMVRSDTSEARWARARVI